jgi:hypothetical protein
MRDYLTIISLLVTVQIASAVDDPARYDPRPLPSLEQRVKDADLIVRLHLETKRGEVVGRIVEVLKGVYHPSDNPESPKGCFAFGIPAHQFKWDHNEEIWILARPDDQVLQLPIRNGIIAYPAVGRDYMGEVTQTQPYKAKEFIAAIRADLPAQVGNQQAD